MKIKNYQKDQNLENILDVLVKEFKPVRVYLFGSRSGKSFTQSSDYDLFLVIENSNLTPRERSLKGREILWDIKFPIDLFIYTEEEFDDWKHEFSSIPYIAFTEGLELDFV